MNIAMRKLALLEKNMLEQEERDRIEGYVSNPSNQEFRRQITRLMDKVRQI